MDEFGTILSNYKPHVGYFLYKRLEHEMNKKIRSVDIEKIDNGFQAEWSVVTFKDSGDEDYRTYDRHTMFFEDMNKLTEWLKTFDFTPAA